MPFCISRSIKDIVGDMKIFRPSNIYMVPAVAEFIRRGILRNLEKRGKKATFERAVKLSRAMLELEKTQDLEEFERLGTGALSRAVIAGDVDHGSVMSGQVAGLVNKEQPAAEIIREMFEEAEQIYDARAQVVKER